MQSHGMIDKVKAPAKISLTNSTEPYDERFSFRFLTLKSSPVFDVVLWLDSLML
ncbi:MAG TPA: hypothetical protein VMT22_25860 [Terriglobales bacterium]|jgi:hypothetical protein|nr:hypothetical protein [Terriglobales bacterium]